MRVTGSTMLVKPFAFEGAMVMEGSIVPDTVASAIPPQQGEVLQIGRDIEFVKVGDNVIFGIGAGQGWEGLLLLSEAEIICKIT